MKHLNLVKTQNTACEYLIQRQDTEQQTSRKLNILSGNFQTASTTFSECGTDLPQDTGKYMQGFSSTHFMIHFHVKNSMVKRSFC